MASSVQHSSEEVKLVAWCYEVCAPVLSDRRHAYRTHGEAPLPVSSINRGVMRHSMPRWVC